MNYLFAIDAYAGIHHYVIRVPLEHLIEFEELDYEEALFPNGVEIMLTDVYHIAGIPISKLELPCHVDRLVSIYLI